jgi:hypothetical protein
MEEKKSIKTVPLHLKMWRAERFKLTVLLL